LQKELDAEEVLVMNCDDLYIVFCCFSFVHQTEEAPPFSCFYYSNLLKTTAHIYWLMSGKAAIVHHNYLRTWLIKFLCKPREVEDRKEIVAATGLGFSIMPHIIL
jgi:hypothetical protein